MYKIEAFLRPAALEPVQAALATIQARSDG